MTVEKPRCIPIGGDGTSQWVRIYSPSRRVRWYGERRPRGPVSTVASRNEVDTWPKEKQ